MAAAIFRLFAFMPIVLAAAAAAIHWSAPLAQGAERPNILFIMSDDHADQAISAYGSELIETPNIDRIAAEGVRFDRCYVTNSICAPCRATILTGKYSHKNGHYDNYSKFDGGQVTFPKLLQAAGYQTAIVGKWHLESEPTGFDHWDVLPGQGKYYRPDFITRDGQTAVPGYVTDVTTDKAIGWLRDGRDASRPFLLMVQHKAPHRNWAPAASKLTKYAAKTFPEPATLFDDYATRGTAAHEAEMRIAQMNPDSDLKLWPSDNRHRVWLYDHMNDEDRATWERVVDPRLAEIEAAQPRSDDLTSWFYQLYMRDYLACIESVDDGVGRLLDYLDKSGLADDTIVVYTSDQGFYLGEHGWFDKRFMYEESLRTPLVVRWPGVAKPGRVEEAIVSNVDFAETFLDAASAAVPDDMQGRSIVPLLRGQTPDDWRDSFYYHYYEGPERDHHVFKHEGVTNGRAKLIHFYTLGEWELYDLEADPHELNNVYDEPHYAELQAELKAELARQRQLLDVPPLDESS
jgi:arylsulfatase A-like enzyme